MCDFGLLIYTTLLTLDMFFCSLYLFARQKSELCFFLI